MRKLDIFGILDNSKSNIQQELNLLVSLNHSNIIQYYDLFELEDFFCVITENSDVTRICHTFSFLLIKFSF
jgi:hypothetical protein